MSPLLLTVALLSLSCSCLIGSPLNPSRVHLVDYNADNQVYLFRGNLPKNGTTDDFVNVDTLLKSVLKPVFDKEKSEHVDQFDYGASDVYLVDVSFVAEILPKEHSDFEMEKHFFEQNPEQGEFVPWLTIGNPVNASALSKHWRHEVLKHARSIWDLDNLHERIPTLNKWVEHGFSSLNRQQNSSKNTGTVIYMHCEAGVDRTGEMAGSYMLQYLNRTYLDTLKFDYSVEPRPIGSFSEHALNWYCWYLNEKYGHPTDCDAWLPRD